MSRGLGTAQRRILSELDRYRFGTRTSSQLAEALEMNPRQVRYALRSLEKRGHVVVTVGGDLKGHRGQGQYGPLRQKRPWHDPSTPTVTVREGETWPGQPDYVAAVDTEFVHEGMPVGLVMTAQLTEARARSDQLRAATGVERIALIDSLFDKSKPID